MLGAQALAAYHTYGKIDVWINNAAVIAFGKFEDIPAHIFKCVIEVNLFGYINGTRVALPYLKKSTQSLLIHRH
jgi:NAD(P)-dependent dehydrogenase (short-subunit alcohol dehydrogenase family)